MAKGSHPKRIHHELHGCFTYWPRMHSPMKTPSLILLAASLLGFSPLLLSMPARSPNAPLAPCIALTDGEAVMLLGAGRQFVSDTTSGGKRSTFGVPLMTEDSVQMLADDAACAAADSTYRVWRVTQGEPDVSIPVALARLGSSGYHFGTGFLADHPNEREYVVFDSGFVVIGIVTYVY